MADLYTARTAIDFQQDLFHELGFGTGHWDEDELWSKICFFSPFHFLCFLLSFSLSSLLWNKYCTMYWRSSVGGIIWEQIKRSLCDPPRPPSPWARSPPCPVSEVLVCVLSIHALVSVCFCPCLSVPYVGYTIKCFRMALSVTWPLGICSLEIMQSRECEQAIRAPRTALRAEELRKTILTPRNDTHNIHLMTAGARRSERNKRMYLKSQM